MDRTERTDEPAAALARARSLIGTVRTFYEEELAAAAAGDMDRLEQLSGRRQAAETHLAELAIELARVQASGPGASGDVRSVREELEALVALAERGHEQARNLKERVLDGARVLRAIRQAAEHYEEAPGYRGAIVDREG